MSMLVSIPQRQRAPRLHRSNTLDQVRGWLDIHTCRACLVTISAVSLSTSSPGFNADNNMYRNLTFAIVISVVNVIDPPEMLTPSPPYRPTLVTALQRTQRFHFFPHRGQTFVWQHYHVLPPVVTAQFH